MLGVNVNSSTSFVALSFARVYDDLDNRYQKKGVDRKELIPQGIAPEMNLDQTASDFAQIKALSAKVKGALFPYLRKCWELQTEPNGQPALFCAIHFGDAGVDEAMLTAFVLLTQLLPAATSIYDDSRAIYASMADMYGGVAGMYACIAGALLIFKEALLTFKEALLTFKEALLTFKEALLTGALLTFKEALRAFKGALLIFKEALLTFKGALLTFKEALRTFKEASLTCFGRTALFLDKPEAPELCLDGRLVHILPCLGFGLKDLGVGFGVGVQGLNRGWRLEVRVAALGFKAQCFGYRGIGV
eukprot:2118975-Rhodomonas_salina.3